ncbi:hypothetical protein P7K49_014646 [Saguinus oedipus]|uniref:CDT1 Geminin-binding domain-containing protein n=1 Tax=Saguinus oedipus TaxID=9490 RepID=A0ABQ9V7C8_SAGOE|nr:hypothetical protein P7K49_014646 [Saguinus oedipus]
MGASRGGRLPLPPVPGHVAAAMPAACPPPGHHQDDRCRRLRQWAAAVSSPLSCRRDDEESHPSADQLPRLATQPDKERESSPCLSSRVPAVDPVPRMLGSPTRGKRGKQTSRGAQRRNGAAAARIFHSVDTLVGTRHNGCKMTTFIRVTQGVRDMMLKRFGERNVANSEPWRLPFKGGAHELSQPLALRLPRFHVDEVLDIEPAAPFQLPTTGQLTITSLQCVSQDLPEQSETEAAGAGDTVPGVQARQQWPKWLPD